MTITSIGFTGTRSGLSEKQREALRFFLKTLRASSTGRLTFLHGGAIGADTEADAIAAELHFLRNVYPVTDRADAWLARMNTESTIIKVSVGLPPLERNRSIVVLCDHLIVFPKELTVQARGGTWMTFRYAKKIGRPFTVLLPDGNVVNGTVVNGTIVNGTR